MLFWALQDAHPLKLQCKLQRIGERAWWLAAESPMSEPPRGCRCWSKRHSYIESPKRQFFDYFLAVFLYIWPRAGPNIAKKEGSLQKLARDDRQTHFGAFNFWLKPRFLTVFACWGMFCVFSHVLRVWAHVLRMFCTSFGEKVASFVNAGFWRLRAPETSIWAPEGAFWPKKAIFP